MTFEGCPECDRTGWRGEGAEQEPCPCVHKWAKEAIESGTVQDLFDESGIEKKVLVGLLNDKLASGHEWRDGALEAGFITAEFQGKLFIQTIIEASHKLAGVGDKAA